MRDGESRTDGALPIGAGRLIIECTKVRGSLHKRWLFRYRTADHTGKLRLGDHPAVGLQDARALARVHIDQVRQGIDPRLASFERKQATIRAEREKALLGTLKSLLDAYCRQLRVQGKRSAHEVELLFDRHLLKPWPQMASMPARAITPEMIRDVLARMIKAGIRRQTNVLRAYLHAAYVHGAHSDLDPRRAADNGSVFRLSSNPVQLLPRIAEYESTRDRVLSDDELKRLWAELGLLAVEIGAAVRCIVLLGGQRFRQVLRVTWSDYDLAAGTLTLSDPKGKRAKALVHVLPVSKQVAEQLAVLRALNGEGTFIFSSTKGARPIHHTTITSVVSKIAKTAAEGGLTYRPSDLRRSVETRLQALGVARDVRAQLLSHGRSSGVQARHYERHDYLAEKTKALRQWESHLDSVTTSKALDAPCQRYLKSPSLRIESIYL